MRDIVRKRVRSRPANDKRPRDCICSMTKLIAELSQSPGRAKNSLIIGGLSPGEQPVSIDQISLRSRLVAVLFMQQTKFFVTERQPDGTCSEAALGDFQRALAH